MGGRLLPGAEAIQRDGLIADDSGAAIHRGGIEPMPDPVRLGPRDEEGAGQMQCMPAGEIDVAMIPHVDRSDFQFQQVEGMHVVQFPVGDMEEAGKAALQVEQGMNVCIFTAALVVRKCAHRNIDGHRSMVVESSA